MNRSANTSIELAPEVVPATSRRWGALVVAVVLIAVPVLVVLTALTRAGDATASAEGAVRTVPSTGPSSAASIELGHVICGDCCVGKIWTAIGSMPGVRDVDAKAGDSKFVLYYDPQITDAKKVLAKLVASGEADAKLAPVAAVAASTERRWVRPAPQKPRR